MQPDEIARRRPVWMALSELWLDTELDEGDWERLAAVLASSPYDVHQLRAIHDAEVAPAVGDNLFSVAGVWDGFDEDWLVSRCVEVADRRVARPGAGAGPGRESSAVGHDADRATAVAT